MRGLRTPDSMPRHPATSQEYQLPIGSDRVALHRASTLLRYALLTSAAAYIAVFLILAFFRIRYPFELEWMEGGVLDHVRRVLAGQKVYVSPSLEFVTFLYTPLYYYLSAGVAKVMGIGFMPLRLVSFVSSLGSFFIIFLMVRRETGSRYSGVLASCLFAATFQISGAWFDLARVDSLFLFLLLAGLYLVRFGASAKAYALAGTVISLSFLAKQTAVLISAPVMLYCFHLNRRHSFYFGGAIVAILGPGAVLLHYIHDGWFTYYTLLIPKRLDFLEEMFVHFWTKDLISPLPIACIMSIFYLSGQLLNRARKEHLFYPLLAVGMLGGPWLSRMKHGSYHNIPMPSYALLSILFGLATHRLLEHTQTASMNRKRLMEISVYLICIIQFARLIYDPFSQVPTREDLEAGWKLVHTIAQTEGEVYVAEHGYLAVLAGKHSYAHAIAIGSLLRSSKGEAEARLIEEIWQAFREERFDLIVLDSTYFLKNWLRETDYEGYCISRRPVFDDASVFWPVTGAEFRPEITMRRCAENQ